MTRDFNGIRVEDMTCPGQWPSCGPGHGKTFLERASREKTEKKTVTPTVKKDLTFKKEKYNNNCYVSCKE